MFEQLVLIETQNAHFNIFVIIRPVLHVIINVIKYNNSLELWVSNKNMYMGAVDSEF